MAGYLRKVHGFSIARSCGLAGLSRGGWYVRAQPRDDSKLVGALRKAAHEHRRWGYRHLTAVLRRQGFRDNHKRIYRVYREQGLQVRRRRRRRRASHRGRPLAGGCRQGEQWGMDFVSDQLSAGRRVRLLCVLDTCTRQCLRIEADFGLPSGRVTRVLDELVGVHGAPERLLSDNGPEFTAMEMDRWSYACGLTHEFIEPGKPSQNGHVESFNRTFREECLNEHWFLDLREVREKVEAWRRFYNAERPHSSLGYMTPDEYAASLRDLSLGAIEREKEADLGRPAPFTCPGHGARVASQQSPILRSGENLRPETLEPINQRMKKPSRD